MQNVSVICSITTLTAISIERYLDTSVFHAQNCESRGRRSKSPKSKMGKVSLTFSADYRKTRPNSFT